MRRNLKHYLNDQCSRVLRNLPYPIKQKAKGFPPISSTDHKSIMAVLCSHKQFLEGLWSLWSWMRYLSPIMSAVLLFDGKVTSEQKKLFQKLFPGGSLLELDTFLAGRPLPFYLKRFILGNWTGKKFAAVFELQKDFDVLYSDCDVIAFSNPDEIIDSIKFNRSAYLHDTVAYPLDPWLFRRAEKEGIPVSNHFNSGLIYVPKGEMRESLLESMLGDWQSDFNTHFSEQTLFSTLLDWKSSIPLPQQRYVLSWQGVWIFQKDLNCRDLVCRHYTGPMRHRMYLSAYPFLLNQIKAEKLDSSRA
jgi:hypothetical protein